MISTYRETSHKLFDYMRAWKQLLVDILPIYAGSNDMHSINVIVLMYSVGVKLEPDINRFNAEIDALYC